MATTRLTDVIVPERFAPYMIKRTEEKSRIFQSGVLRPDAKLAGMLAGGGRTFNVPFWNDLGNQESNVGSDDPASESTPQKTSASKDVAIRHNRNQSWSDADLVSELAGDDPMKMIGSAVASYWNRDFQRLLVNSLEGVIADNDLNDLDDMITDVSTQGSVTDLNRISAENILTAKQQLGDSGGDLAVVVMHSLMKTKLQKLNLIDFIPDARGEINIPTYLGYEVIEDDGVTVVNLTNDVYWVFLLGRGAIAFAEKPPAVPVEIERKPAQGTGQGIEILYTRRQFVMHPYGIKFTDLTVAGASPTNAELVLDGNWDRVYPERKQIKIVLLKVNA